MKEIKAHACAEITEKKSRFIANVFPSASAEEAASHIKDIVKTHYDARHHCYAFRIAADTPGAPDLERASDDGEPQGTAGGPILQVLRGEDITNALIVVTRYFGGTLLGTGGLVRAYTQAAQAGLNAAQICEKLPAKGISVNVPYAQNDLVQYLFSQHGITPEHAQYGASVDYDIIVRQTEAEAFLRELQQKTDGKAAVRITGSFFHAF